MGADDTVVAICQAYVQQHKRHPGVFSIMFRGEHLNVDDPVLTEAKPASLAQLVSAVRDALPPALPDGRVEQVAKTLWAAMHGLVTLGLGEEAQLVQRATFAARTILAGAAQTPPDAQYGKTS